MQIELSEQEIETVLTALLTELGHLNQCLSKDTSTFRPVFENTQKNCNQLYDKLNTHLKEYKE